MAMARDLCAIVVPGTEVARARGLDLAAAGLRITASPRHANVLLLVDDLPAALLDAAVVLYAQMMRPRLILALGGDGLPGLNADVAAAVSQPSLDAAVVQLRSALAQGAFHPAAQDFHAAALLARIEYTCPMHPEIVRTAPGDCPKCGMTLVARETQGGEAPTPEPFPPSENDPPAPNAAHVHDDETGHAHAGHGGIDHSGSQHDASKHDASKHDDSKHDDSKHSDSKHSDSKHDGSQHGGMDHGGMDHGDMDFMSMVDVTKDLPRSSDDLPMDWIDVPFGPVFPGLPGGLSLTLTLDGDTVAGVQAQSLVGVTTRLSMTDIEPHHLVDGFERLDPLAPVAYRFLACRALEAASGHRPAEDILRGRVAALERERIASHLGWLAMLGCQSGFAWLERRAAHLQRACLQADFHALMSLQSALLALLRRLNRTPLLRARLTAIGTVGAAPELRGPVARASGMALDARNGDAAYQALAFAATGRAGGDAFDRLQVRVDEIRHSLTLIQSAGDLQQPLPCQAEAVSGAGQAAVETPRGEARLQLTLEQGRVTGALLQTPSTHHLSLLGTLLAQQELGDALSTVCSLDLSPWEIML